MHFKAVLFDMDGTLINSVDDIADAMNLVLMQNNFHVHAVNKYLNWIGDGLKNLVINALPQNYREDATINKCLEEMKVAYSEMWINKTHLYSGISEMLSSLRILNIKMAVLSNKHHKFTRIIADKLLAEWNFDVVMGYREGFPRKPDPTSALEISRQLKLDPSCILYLGDSATDMKTATNAGMYPVGVSWGYRSTDSLIESGAQKIIYHPLELLSLF
jgi:phosphoglycolate phosphatase